MSTKAQTTRTLNPLPFQDLEPHRFEDLVRQLAYDFRHWNSLEAIGRSGSDGGMDVRGIELVQAPDDGADQDQPVDVRTWIFQCKREKRLTPQKVVNACLESIPKGGPVPHGFVLATSADVSKKGRDGFRDLMVELGVEEFFLWARGELEDQLFQAKNDRLLFAYFGLSLSHRRRSTGTRIRSSVSIKRQIRKMFATENDGESDGGWTAVVVQNAATWGEKPNPKDVVLAEVLTEFHPQGLIARDAEYHAFIGPDGAEWDILEQFNLIEQSVRRSIARAVGGKRRRDRTEDARWEQYWRIKVADSCRASFTRHRVIPFDRIVAVDPIGVHERPIPHLYVDFSATGDPFHPDRQGAVLTRGAHCESVSPEPESRIRVFPDELTDSLFDLPWLGPIVEPDHEAPLDDGILGAIDEVLEPVPASPSARAPSIRTSPTPSDIEAERWISTVAEPVVAAFVRAVSRHQCHSRATRTPRGLLLKVWTPRGSISGNPTFQTHEIGLEVDGWEVAELNVRVTWKREYKDATRKMALGSTDQDELQTVLSAALVEVLSNRWK